MTVHLLKRRGKVQPIESFLVTDFVHADVYFPEQQSGKRFCIIANTKFRHHYLNERHVFHSNLEAKAYFSKGEEGCILAAHEEPWYSPSPSASAIAKKIRVFSYVPVSLSEPGP